MDAGVDRYVARSKKWPEEISALRPLLLDRGLSEQIKWGKPCYSHDGANILILQEMNDFLSVMFFKGALLSDPEGVLSEQGPNSRSARRMELTSVEDVNRLADTVRAYVDEAMAVEDAGLEVGPAPEPELPDELRERLADDDDLATAFDALTPGRRREYVMHIADAKQSKTRVARIERYVPKILAGRGMRD